MEKNQTAVDYAVEKLEKFIPSGNQIAIDVILEKAKEMEKQQIIKTRQDIYVTGDLNNEQYYNQTFKRQIK